MLNLFSFLLSFLVIVCLKTMSNILTKKQCKTILCMCTLGPGGQAGCLGWSVNLLRIDNLFSCFFLFMFLPFSLEKIQNSSIFIWAWVSLIRDLCALIERLHHLPFFCRQSYFTIDCLQQIFYWCSVHTLVCLLVLLCFTITCQIGCVPNLFNDCYIQGKGHCARCTILKEGNIFSKWSLYEALISLLLIVSLILDYSILFLTTRIHMFMVNWFLGIQYILFYHFSQFALHMFCFTLNITSIFHFGKNNLREVI